MILYHGSNQKFESFMINEKLSRHDISVLAEGYGIYFAESENFASSYGSYIYTIELDDEDFSDFTCSDYLEDLFDKLEKDSNIPISSLIKINQIIDGVLCGKISTTTLYKEINDNLDSVESFHMDYGHLITYEDDCIYEKIKECYFHYIKDIIKYYDKSFNQSIYICYRNPEKLKIESIIKI